MVEAADPGYDPFDSHAEAAVGDAAVTAQIEQQVRAAPPGLRSYMGVAFPGFSSAVSADFILGYFRGVPPGLGAWVERELVEGIARSSGVTADSQRE